MRYNIILTVVFLLHIIFNLYVGAKLLNKKSKLMCLLTIVTIFILSIKFAKQDLYFITSMYLLNFLIVYRELKNYLFSIYYILSEYLVIQISLIGAGSIYFTIIQSDYNKISTIVFYALLSLMIIIFGGNLHFLNWFFQKFDVYLFLYKMSNANKRVMSIFLSLFIIFAYYQRILEDITRTDYWLVTMIIFLMSVILFGGVYLIIKATVYYDTLNNTINLYDEKVEKMGDLKGFQHDYEGILLSLTTALEEGDTNEALEQLKKIKGYSKKAINSNSHIDELGLVKCLPLKSIFYLGVNKAKESGIEMDIYCNCEITDIDISMNILDLIRCITILLNNALEASLETKKPYVSLSIKKQYPELQIIIKNNYIKQLPLYCLEEKGITSKIGHSGLGLNNLKNIISMYNNVQYNISRNHQFFEVVLSLKKIDKKM
ncbi:hypothetical protein BH747_09880 [Enterococcus villorum]|uniref:Sensor histidine kinase NatK-like C-terminal domain-containing protein n=1 Tax=Enterococcus villorum TaxID=112904 RepID=A0A1V8YJ47_9ENTE|nr:GHKL domain-containing protein [Enterococcus villorum]OQO69570.1 hypothetical protein BH747_09880 [Enterococcus villorum]OQO72639.1 hypothetical protein BH744_11220 [Enterococcus villorum]